MIHSYMRGHKIEFVNNEWLYSDDKSPANDNRPCINCGHLPTKEGFDHCLGYLKGIKSACCGHGVSRRFRIIKEA